jgi:hypothetical protein
MAIMDLLPSSNVGPTIIGRAAINQPVPLTLWDRIAPRHRPIICCSRIQYIYAQTIMARRVESDITARVSRIHSRIV